MWTMVGGGIKTLEQSRRAMADIMPRNATWYKESVQSFEPGNNTVHTLDGTKIEYEFLIVGVGLKVNFNKVDLGTCGYMMLLWKRNPHMILVHNE